MFRGYSHLKLLPDIKLPLEAIMKKLFVLLLPMSIFAFSAIASQTGLSSAEIQKLFSDKTMTVTEVERDKKNKENSTFTAHLSKMGAARAIYPDGAATTYGWSVDEKGRVCFGRMKRKTAVCGFITDAGGGTYNFYTSKKTSKRTVMKDDKPVKDKNWKLSTTFSDFKDGEKL
jgi:hypothetical protein